jgi:ATP-dependent Clp protease protease subunit
MKEALREKRLLTEILARHTGKSFEVIEAETERNRYFTAQEAKDFGLVDDVLVKMGQESRK